MRKDMDGNEVPATLGEYRDYCVSLGGEDCKAVKWLDKKIAEQGRDMEVLADDLQMRFVLLPMIQERG